MYGIVKDPNLEGHGRECQNICQVGANQGE